MRRRIAVIAPPWYSVPPCGYGGIELVVGLLASELRRQGHDVVLFAAEGSAAADVTAAPRSWGRDLGAPTERLRELAYATRVAQQLAALGPFDVVHDHCGGATLLSAALEADAPVVHTAHGAIAEPDATYYASLPVTTALVSISEAQRRSGPGLRWLGTVHNAVDVNALTVGTSADKEPYLLCLARVCADKGQHTAIEVARRLGMRLVLAGKIEATPAGREYWERLIAPHVDGDRVVHLTNVAGADKARVLAQATALLAPLQWEEPFGLAMAEAMASGTPVVAFPRGAAPELIESGVTGWLVDSVDAMVRAVGHVRDIDPLQCAAAARRRFSPPSMARGYLAMYERLMGEPWSMSAAAETTALWSAGTATAELAGAAAG
jgi:glycosyltransferase involved in cell wall biosynthesis